MKKIISGLILATLMGGTVTPAMAATGNVQISISNTPKIEQSYGVSYEESLTDIKITIQAINEMRNKGTVSDSLIEKLASQIYALGQSVNYSDNIDVNNIAIVLDSAENVVAGLSNSSKVEIAVTVTRAMLNIEKNIKGDSLETNEVFAPQMITSFSDVQQGSWYYEPVMIIAQKGIIAGTTAPVNGVGTYNPNGQVTIGEFLTLSTRLVASDKINDEGDFAHWAVPYYQAAVESGLITSQQYACTPEVLNTPMSREDMAMVLVNIAKANGEELVSTFGIENNISDYSSVDSMRKEAVKLAYSNGLITGKGNGRFAPKDTLTRAEVATVFCRVMNYTQRPEVVVQSNQNTQTEATTEYSKYVVTEEGQTTGSLRPIYSDQYNIEAMNGVKYGEDSNGVYVEVTAPILPDVIKGDFKISYSFVLHEADGTYFAEDIDFTLSSGESNKVYFNSHQDTKVLSSEIGDASVYINIYNINNARYMKSIEVESTNKSKARVDWYNNTNSSVIDFNSSHIFVGIGK